MVEEFLQISYDSDNKIWTSVHYPYKDQIQGSLGEKFLKTMRNIDPNKIIDHFYDTNRQKIVKEVYEQSISIATNLKRLGIKKSDVVVFFCMNNEDVAVLTMGCILIGALVNFFEIYMEDEHIDYVLNLLKPNMILYEEKHKHKCFQSLKRTNLKSCKYKISIDGHIQPNIENELLKCNGVIDFDKFKSVEIADPQNELAFLGLTSGSTGIPKVVQITHTLLMNGCYIWWNNKNNYEPLNEDSVLFSFSPLRWISQDVILFESMIMGIKRVSSCEVHSGQYGIELMRKCQLTHLFAVPSIFYSCLLQLDEHDIESLKSIKILQLGGEAPSSVLVDLANKHCVNAKVFRCYGMTEMSSCIANDEKINGGKLSAGYQMQILDDQCKPLGPNQEGQIALRPPCPLKGYKGVDCKKYYNEQGFFINGDYGFIDGEGNLHVLARYKDLIYFKDLVLIPNILEHIVMELPEIQVARLAGYRISPNKPNEIAAFFVVLNQGVTTAQKDISEKIFNLLITHLKPKEVDIIQNIYYVDSVPTTTCGKIDRVALKNLALKKARNK